MNIFYKQLWTANKGLSCSLWVGQGLTTSHSKKPLCYDGKNSDNTAISTSPYTPLQLPFEASKILQILNGEINYGTFQINYKFQFIFEMECASFSVPSGNVSV
jgi:hypothetical protein